MTNKEKLKKAIIQDINPTNYYNEIIKKIEKGERMKNKSNIWKRSLVPICLAILISGVLFFNSQNRNLLKNDKDIDKENDINLKINNINMTLTKADIAGFAIDLTYKELIKEEEFIANIEVLSSFKNSRLMKRYDENNEFIGYDLIYYNTNNNQISKEIEIFFSKTLKRKPSCYETINLDKLEDSVINDINVKILKSNNKYYYILFNYNNYNFDIITTNITEQELSSLLLSIIK